MSTIADKLMERRKGLLEQAEKFAEESMVEGREWSGEDQAKFDKMIGEAEGLKTRALAIKEGDEQSRALEESFRSVTGREPGERRDDAEGAFGKWAREARVGDGFEVKPTKADVRNMRRPLAEQRAMSASGGVGADSVYNQLWQYVLSYGQIMQAGVDIINTSDGNTLPLPVATAHASTGTPTVVAANAALTASDATITTVNLAVSKYGYLTLVPTELVQDTNFDLEGYIAQAAGRELARTVSAIAVAAAIAGFTTQGQLGPTGTTTSLGTQSTAGMGTDLLFGLFHSVLPEYRTDAAWLMTDPSIGIIRNLKSTTGGPVWQPAVTAGDPDLIAGKPVYFAPQLPVMAANAKSIYFGEWSALKVRVAGGIRFERSEQYAFGNDQVAFRAVVRCGAVTVDPNAVKFFQNSAT